MTARRGTPIGEVPPASLAGIAHVDYGLCAGWPTAAIVLRYSRAVWAEPIRAVTARELGRVMAHAAHYFGGSPRRFCFEGPAVAVANWRADRWVFAAELAEVARLLRSELDVCPGGAMRRGLCEGVLASPGTHWPVGCRPGQADATQRLQAFHDRNARRKRHPFQPKRTIAQVLADERPLLLPLPEGFIEAEGA